MNIDELRKHATREYNNGNKRFSNGIRFAIDNLDGLEKSVEISKLDSDKLRLQEIEEKHGLVMNSVDDFFDEDSKLTLEQRTAKFNRELCEIFKEDN